jgi:hypothetical protein
MKQNGSLLWNNHSPTYPPYIRAASKLDCHWHTNTLPVARVNKTKQAWTCKWRRKVVMRVVISYLTAWGKVQTCLFLLWRWGGDTSLLSNMDIHLMHLKNGLVSPEYESTPYIRYHPIKKLETVHFNTHLYKNTFMSCLISAIHTALYTKASNINASVHIFNRSHDNIFFNSHSEEWSPNWVHSARRPGDCEDGEFDGMEIGRGNRSTGRKPAPAPLCPPQIPLDHTRAGTRAVAVGSQRPTAWAMARPWEEHRWRVFVKRMPRRQERIA